MVMKTTLQQREQKMTKEIIYSYRPETIRAFEEDDRWVLEGYASVFNVVDSYGTRTIKGSFKKSLKESMPIPMLWNHNPDEVIGQWESGYEDAKGLFVKGYLNKDIARAAEVYSNYKKKILKGLSIGARLIKGEDSEDGIYDLKELALMEISPVTFAANPEAMVEMVRSAENYHKLNSENEEILINKIVELGIKELNKYDSEEELLDELNDILQMSLVQSNVISREDATNILLNQIAGLLETGGAEQESSIERADEINSPHQEPDNHSDDLENILTLLKEKTNERQTKRD